MYRFFRMHRRRNGSFRVEKERRIERQEFYRLEESDNGGMD